MSEGGYWGPVRPHWGVMWSTQDPFRTLKSADFASARCSMSYKYKRRADGLSGTASSSRLVCSVGEMVSSFAV